MEATAASTGATACALARGSARSTQRAAATTIAPQARIVIGMT